MRQRAVQMPFRAGRFERNRTLELVIPGTDDAGAIRDFFRQRLSRSEGAAARTILKPKLGLREGFTRLEGLREAEIRVVVKNLASETERHCSEAEIDDSRRTAVSIAAGAILGVGAVVTEAYLAFGGLAALFVAALLTRARSSSGICLENIRNSKERAKSEIDSINARYARALERLFISTAERARMLLGSWEPVIDASPGQRRLFLAHVFGSMKPGVLGLLNGSDGLHGGIVVLDSGELKLLETDGSKSALPGWLLEVPAIKYSFMELVTSSDAPPPGQGPVGIAGETQPALVACKRDGGFSAYYAYPGGSEHIGEF